jgi:DNA-binding PadR family transcriptional regulator
MNIEYMIYPRLGIFMVEIILFIYSKEDTVMIKMLVPLPDLPDLNWFEIEILNFLKGQERYGNEMLTMLNEHLGEGTVSSGKLYSDLKKMEKKGFINRTKRRREKGEGLMTRGVDRIYFTITDNGREALGTAERYMSSWFFDSMLQRSSEKIPRIIERILSTLGPNSTVGVAVDPSRLGIARAMDLLPEMDGVKFALLLISNKDDLEPMTHMDAPGKDMASFPSNDDDIPLKDGYLDAVISIYPLTRAKRERTYVNELMRIVRKGGKVVVIDFSKLESYILEDVFRSQMGWSEKDLRGHDSRGIRELLSSHLQKVEVKRFKEQYIAWGRKTR